MTLTHVNVGTVSDLLQASGELTRTLCEESYPGLWRLVEEKIIENMELDDGI
jgi:hypothetical protein